MKTTEELQALQNSAENLKIEGLNVVEFLPSNRRVGVKKYTLSLKGTGISPVLDYDKMNHFLLGMHRMKEISEINW
jgi:hypothetical protein